jgi:hypothetical protein
MLTKVVRRSAAKFGVFFFTLSFFTFELFRTFSNYLLSWDDADYLRVSSCFAHAGINVFSQNFYSCENLIYKSPIFLHIGYILGYPFNSFRNFTSDQTDFLIEISIAGLFLLNMTLLAYILFKFKSIAVQALFSISAIFIFNGSFTLFMTDVTASLIAILMIVLHIKQEEIISHRNYFWIQFVLFFLAVGTRTTCAPLIIIVFFAYRRLYRFDRKLLKQVSGLSVICLLVFFLLLLYLWRPVLPAAWAMFGGNQSAYFGSWVRAGEINLLLIGLKEYSYTIVLIMVLVLLAYKMGSWRKLFTSKYLIAAVPSVTVVFLFAISESKDPRFLLWPLSTLTVILLMCLDEQLGPLEGVENQRIFMLVSGLAITISSALVIPLASNTASFGLGVAKDVYRSIPAQGIICPLTDSPDLNISKVLLVDSLNGNVKSINSRIMNIPDSVMNGLNLSQVLQKVDGCDFAYFQSKLILGGMKNEFTSEITQYLVGRDMKVSDYGKFLSIQR